MTRPKRPTVRVNAVARVGDAIHADVTSPDGLRRLHILPADTIEWRAAEYGMDPDDDALLGMVIAEPYLDGVAPADPDLTLATAPTIKEARTHHLSRLAALEVDMPAAARADLRRHSVVDPEAIEVKGQIVDMMRREHVERQRQEKDRPAGDRIDKLRERLRGGNTKERRNA